MSDSVKYVYPTTKHPYYIVTPPYTRTSAGIKSLHLLCHSLNRAGSLAYLVLDPISSDPADTSPDLLTPILTQRTSSYHASCGAIPIVVYPETVRGNPLGAACVVRYVLNFPGLLGGDQSYAESELCFGYSQLLAEAAGVPENILFIPATDTRVFHPGPPASPNESPNESPNRRRGTCFYASKYQEVHAGPLFDITRDSVEITRNLPSSPTPEQLAALFRRSELFYTYENTALAIEAVLCGCPAVFLPNPHLKEIIALHELGRDGYAWGAELQEVARAKATVFRGRSHYLRLYGEFWQQLDRFIAATQAHAAQIPCPPPILPSEVRPKGIRDVVGVLTNAWGAARRHGIAGLLQRTQIRILEDGR